MICAPFIFVAALTGLVYAAAPTLEQVVYHDVLTAEAPSEGSEPLPVSGLVATAQSVHPDLTLSGVRIGAEGEATRVLFKDSQLPASTVRAVIVDPFSGEVKADTTQYGSSASLPLRKWISDGHRSLWLGQPGRLYSELAASWLGVLAVGGIVLWWDRQRSSSRLRGMLRTDGRGRVRTMRRHGATGTLVIAGLLFLTITGLTWSSVAGTNIGTVRQALHWGTPTVNTQLATPGDTGATGGDTETSDAAGDGGGDCAHHDHQALTGASEDMSTGGNTAGIDRVADTATQELRTPLTLTPPAQAGEAWSAAEARVSYRLQNNAIAVDPATGEVTSRLDFASWPLAAQATAWLIQLHMGTLFGAPNQIILALLAIAIMAMVGWGYVMWWRRRPRGSWWAAPPRKAESYRPSAATMVLALILVAYGIVAPLFGITWVVFLVVGWLARVTRQWWGRRHQNHSGGCGRPAQSN